MTSNVHLLEKDRSLRAIPISLSNGKEVLAIKNEDVHMSDKRRLRNVLYVPTLNCNLFFFLTNYLENCCNTLVIIRKYGLKESEVTTYITTGAPFF